MESSLGGFLGLTAGCGNGNYCPDDSVTRAQMAMFLLPTAGGLPLVVGSS